jgi:hypothetical protein
MLGALTVARNSDYRTEEAIWRDTLSKRPANARAYESLGRVLADRMRFDEAIGLFQEAIKLKPSSWQAYYNLAMAMGRRKECQETLVQLRQSLGLPAVLQGCHVTAQDPAEQGALQEIARRASQRLSWDPGEMGARRDLAVASLLLGKRQAAVEHFLQLLIGGLICSPAPCRPLTDHTHGTSKAQHLQPAPELGAIVAAIGPLGIKEGQMDVDGGLSDPKDIGPLASNDVTHHAAAMPGSADDLLDRNAFFRQGQDRGIGLFSP